MTLPTYSTPGPALPGSPPVVNNWSHLQVMMTLHLGLLFQATPPGCEQLVSPACQVMMTLLVHLGLLFLAP